MVEILNKKNIAKRKNIDTNKKNNFFFSKNIDTTLLLPLYRGGLKFQNSLKEWGSDFSHKKGGIV